MRRSFGRTGMPLIFTILTSLSRKVMDSDFFAASNLSRTSLGRSLGVVIDRGLSVFEGLIAVA